jgi:hypothetical protein
MTGSLRWTRSRRACRISVRIAVSAAAVRPSAHSTPHRPVFDFEILREPWIYYLFAMINPDGADCQRRQYDHTHKRTDV